MADLINLLAQWIHAILPAFVRLPSLTFALPHVAYWGGIIVFPLIAMYLVRREMAHGAIPGKVALPMAYMLWLVGGIVGLHRFYLRAPRLAFAYIVPFVGILYGNEQIWTAREGTSSARHNLSGAEFDIERFGKAVEKGLEGATEKLAKAEQALGPAQMKLAETNQILDQWQAFVGGMGLVIFVLLVIDAVLLPRLYRRCLDIEAREPSDQKVSDLEPPTVTAPRRDIHNPVVDFIDWINGWVGEFIAYWSVMAVFVYFYEVLARYVFNSPTNWAHEGMFLMFGMQYLLAGGYAAREDAHVRVDIIYERLSERAKAMTDIVTSIFFFIFTVTLLVTGTIFVLDAISVWEVSFTEWSIQYWPVKCSITIGALLIILQGVAKLIRDVIYFRQLGA
ncbi:MAG: TRAP transporter small permease subunit [Proteobacteria bacterium]|nr:TRAP transporter small permease subunit [Pseudomonadota bacterium]